MKRLVLLILAAFLMSPLSSVWAADPLVVYVFQEGSGDVVHDVSGVSPALDLTAADPGNISWIPDGGLSIDEETIVISDGPATKVNEACLASNEITMEVWHKPANTTQGGPARMVSISQDSTNRNISFMQNGGEHHVRCRTTTTGNNGMNPTTTAPTIVTDRMLKGVYSRDEEGAAKFYIDGKEVGAAAVGGDFSNWDPSYRIMLGNEEAAFVGTNRFWLGELYYVAIYSEALTPDELLPPPPVHEPVEPEEKLATTWGEMKVK